MIAAAMGWIGTIGTICAYVMLSRGRWGSSSLRYAAVNCVGGLLGAAASSAYGAWPSVASNLLWAAVALQSTVMTVRARRRRRDLVQVQPQDDSDGPPTGPQPILLSAA